MRRWLWFKAKARAKAKVKKDAEDNSGMYGAAIVRVCHRHDTRSDEEV